MKFKAKPKVLDYETDQFDWIEEKIDDDGYVTGYYVDGYIVGDFAEVTNEYVHLEFWIPIQMDTLKEVKQSKTSINDVMDSLNRERIFDPVEKPSHYNKGKFEVIDVIEDWNLGFHLGNVVKYVARNEHKENPLEDLKKAKYYLDRLIKEVEKEEL